MIGLAPEAFVGFVERVPTENRLGFAAVGTIGTVTAAALGLAVTFAASRDGAATRNLLARSAWIGPVTAAAMAGLSIAGQAVVAVGVWGGSLSREPNESAPAHFARTIAPVLVVHVAAGVGWYRRRVGTGRDDRWSARSPP